ncbi:MAG: cation:proton antiporter, partial [Candidatus Limnocylindria bacterium]
LSVQRGRPFSAALIYLVAGVLAGLGLRAIGINWYEPIEDASIFHRAAELAVIVSLFGVGVKLDRPLDWRSWRTTVLLLAIAMPLTIAGMALLGTWLLAMSLPSAVLLGAILAPTDPVLAEDVQVAGPMQREPEDEARFAITSEAGLNDGLAFPFVMLALFGFERGFDTFDTWWWEWVTADLLYAVIAGVAIGVLAGRLISWLTYRIIDRGWLANPFDAFVAIGAVFAVYGATELAGGYGFLAVFAAGVTFRRYEHRHGHGVNERLHDVTLVIEKLGELAVLLLLGSVLPIGGGLELGWPVLVVAFGLIFVVRPLAVLVALMPSDLVARQRLFIAWFGIRGIGSIYYLGFAFAALTPADARPIFSVTAVAILVSVLLHGLTSGPLTGRLLAAEEASAREEDRAS